MKKLLLVTLTLAFHQDLMAKCVPPRTVVDYPAELAAGMYHRVHPSGKYVLASGADTVRGNNVSIIDMTAKDADGKVTAKAIPTPMINETYAIEGSWSHIASPLHEDGMRYYKFEDILKKNIDAKPVFNDSEHNEYYHSAVELPGSNKTEYKFRTMLWSQRYRDYTLSYDKDGKLLKKTVSKTKIACGKEKESFDSPILSKDGSEIAVLEERGTVIYKLKADSSCEVADDLKFFTSKVNFSYPKAGSKGKIVFTGEATVMVNSQPTRMAGVFLYDRDTKETTRLNAPSRSGGSYPGMTKDGRVVYIDDELKQIVTVDPNQLKEDGTEAPNDRKCIHESGSSRSRRSGTAPRAGNASKQ